MRNAHARLGRSLTVYRIQEDDKPTLPGGIELPAVKANFVPALVSRLIDRPSEKNTTRRLLIWKCDTRLGED
jgi:hypothetical protein